MWPIGLQLRHFRWPWVTFKAIRLLQPFQMLIYAAFDKISVTYPGLLIETCQFKPASMGAKNCSRAWHLESKSHWVRWGSSPDHPNVYLIDIKWKKYWVMKFDVWYMMYDGRCSMYDVRCAMYDVWCLRYDVWWAMFDVWCSMYDVWCAM